VVAPRNRRPPAALAWLLLITWLPFIGILHLALNGSPKLPRVRRDKQQRTDDRITERGSNFEDISRSHETPVEFLVGLAVPRVGPRSQVVEQNLRNHRKLLVADGELAIVDSMNLIDPSYDKLANQRRGLLCTDLIAEVRGPVVHEVDAVFITDWYSETGDLLTTS